MALPATDDFAGTGALSASWTAYGNSGPPERDSGAASSATGSGGSNGFAWWDADAFNDDQVSTVVLGENNAISAVGVRITGTEVADTNGYFLFIINSTTLRFQRADNGSFTQVGTDRTVTALVADDEVTLEAQGDDFVAKVNNVQQGAAFTDATYPLGAAGFLTSETVADHLRAWTGDNLASASAAITGTATAAIDEADVVAGGKTIIITLTNDTWVASGGTFDGQRQAIIDGLDSAQSEGTGWNAEVRDNLATTTVVRTSDTIVTITLSAQAAYDITAQETITVTVPGSALTGGSPLTGVPTFTVSTVGAGGQPPRTMHQFRLRRR